MPTTVQLVKLSALAQIQADLEAAVAADAAAALNSQNSAAASAASALAAISGAFKGGLAGNAVPNTSTTTGDTYRITSAGTSQGKTWAVGDAAIYGGTSGSWTQLTGFYSGATSYADGIAAAQKAGWDSFFFDGVTSGSRVYWTNTTATQIGTSDFTIVLPIRSLSQRAASVNGLFMLTDSANGAGYSAGAFHAYLNGYGLLHVNIGNDTNGRYYQIPAASFYNLYVGRTGDLVVRRAAGVISVDWVEGRTVSSIALPAETYGSNGSGSAPAWSSSVAGSYLVVGSAFSGAQYSGELGVPQFINRAWSASDLTYWSRHRRLPAKDRATGNQQPLADPTLASDSATIWNDSGNVFTVGSGQMIATAAAQYNAIYAQIAGGNRAMSAGQTVRYSITVTAITGSWVLQQGGNGAFIQSITTTGTFSGTYTATANDSTTAAWALKQLSTGTGAITVSAISLVYEGALIQPEVTRVAQVLDHGLNRIRGVITNGVVPLSDRDSLPIRGSVSATGFALGLGANDPVWYEPGLITSLRIKQATASAQTITLRLNTSGGTTIATATTAANTDWQSIALAIPAGFEVSTGDRLHWTITNAIDWDLTWSRR